MQLSATARDLFEALRDLTVIDAHQHLPAEADYLAFGYSGLNMFAGGYIWHDLESAGLSPEFKATMREGGPRPVETWWPVIAPYWEQIKYGSYARALRITARDLYGLPDINDDTIGEFAAHIRAENAPGLYEAVLQQTCRIETTITCVDRASFPDDPGLVGITDLLKLDEWDPVRSFEREQQREVGSIEEMAEATQALLRQDLAQGAVGFKMMVAEYPKPDLAAAEAEFRQAKRGEGHGFSALNGYLFDKAVDVAAEANVPVAVHTGYWGDFRDLDPKRMFSFARRRRDVQFDMFHLGMPMARDAAMMGKTLPNVTLNLTWCPVISQQITGRTLGEMIDLVPMNKIIAFGGDYRVAVQKTYGHLYMAKETVAAALAWRVDSGEFDRAEARRIAGSWLYDNPRRIYRLDQKKG